MTWRYVLDMAFLAGLAACPLWLLYLAVVFDRE